MSSSIHYVKEILFLLGDERRKLLWLLCLFLLSSLLELVGFGLIGPYMSLVVNSDILTGSRILGIFEFFDVSLETNELIVLIGSGLVSVFLVKTVGMIFIQYKILNYSFYQRTRLSSMLMFSYQNMPYVKFIRRNSSEYLYTISSMTGSFSSGVLPSSVRCVGEGMVLLIILIALAWTDIKVLGLLVVIFGGLMFGYDRLFRKKLTLYGKQTAEYGATILKFVSEAMMGLKEIRILGKERHFQIQVKKSTKKQASVQVKRTLIGLSSTYLIQLCLVFFLVLSASFFILIGDNKSAFIPLLAVFAIAALRLFSSVNAIIGGLAVLRSGRFATSVLYKDIKEIRNNNTILPLLSKKVEQSRDVFSNMMIKNSYFRYPNATKDALEDVTVSFNSGESIGFIGSSGAGKTTIVDVILGLLEPYKGDIFYNGNDLKDEITNWRSQVAYIPQEIFLIDDTLRSNVCLGVPDNEIDEDHFHESLRQTRLTELLEQLPQGVNTILGERGVSLSGGQRQRVALARAFYHQRNVLVMDEATSALDNEAETEIVEEIKRLKGKKTFIVIAHRLETIKHCDRIYRLEKGKIVEYGTYQQVISSKQKELESP